MKVVVLEKGKKDKEYIRDIGISVKMVIKIVTRGEYFFVKNLMFVRKKSQLPLKRLERRPGRVCSTRQKT